jgi:hypothetical protein
MVALCAHDVETVQPPVSVIASGTLANREPDLARGRLSLGNSGTVYLISILNYDDPDEPPNHLMVLEPSG